MHLVWRERRRPAQAAIDQDGWCEIRMADDALVRNAAISEARALPNFAPLQQGRIKHVESVRTGGSRPFLEDRQLDFSPLRA